MRVSVTLAATLVTISLVTVLTPSAAAISEGSPLDLLVKVGCHDGQPCEICDSVTGPGSVQDKVRECLQD